MEPAKIFCSFIIILIISDFSSSESDLDKNKIPLTFAGKTFYIKSNLEKKFRLNTTELVRRDGYDCEELDVTTEDGYILKLFHILTDNITQNLPILLVHGFMDSTDTFCIRPKISPAIHLTESGYDVWLANMRGNRYSRRHTTLDPDKDKEFWDFSFHENGYYDIPAHIDRVLESTGNTQLILIGHSQGTLNHFIMGATRPEYNSKVKVSIALGPVFYMQHNLGLAATAPVSYPAAYAALTTLGQVELLNQNSTLRRIMQTVCTEFKEASYKFCLYGAIFPLLGFDAEQIEPEFVPVMMGQYLAGSSVKTVGHGSQFVRKHYGQFDYGRKRNLEIYGAPKPPLYNLTNISTKVVLMVGKNDFLASVPDSIMLRDALPNVTYFEMPLEKFTHVDFSWGRKMTKYFYPYLHKFLDKYK